jgi:hypothetical protein
MDMELDWLDAKMRDYDRRMDDFSWSGDRVMSAKRGDLAYGREPFATSPRAAWLQGDAADSVYKSAYELLNRGEWRRAAASFGSIPQRFPSSGIRRGRALLAGVLALPHRQHGRSQRGAPLTGDDAHEVPAGKNAIRCGCADDAHSRHARLSW